MAVGVACKTDGARTRRLPHPFPPNPALGLGMCGERHRQRTAPPGCTGGDDSAYTRAPSQSASTGVLVCERDLPMEVIKQKCLRKSRSRVRSASELSIGSEVGKMPVIPLFGPWYIFVAHQPSLL